MSRPPIEERFVEFDGQKYVDLKDGLFLKHPELFNTLYLWPPEKLKMFFSIWHDFKNEENNKPLIVHKQGTVQIKGDCSQCPYRFSDDPSCSNPEIRLQKSRKSHLKVHNNDFYFYYDVIIVRHPNKRTDIYFKDFREVSIEEVLDRINQQKTPKPASKTNPKKRSIS